jgi:hypothetical protein
MDQPKSAPLPPAAYANFLRVAQSRSEFFLAFGQIAQPEVAGAHLVSSLVTSPAHAKSMLRTLAEAVARYEKRFGAIPAAQGPSPIPGAAGRPASGPASAEPPAKSSPPKGNSGSSRSRGRRAKSA